MGHYFQGGATETDLSDLTIGVDNGGFFNFITNVVNDTTNNLHKELEKTEGIIEAVNKGWQGVSRDIFLEQLDSSIEKIKNDISREHDQLQAILLEVMDSYYSIDSNLLSNE